MFLGALLTGPFADRWGRRPVFAYNMLLLALCAGLQFFGTLNIEPRTKRMTAALWNLKNDKLWSQELDAE